MILAYIIFVVTAIKSAGDGEAALADLGKFPPADQWRYKYVTTATVTAPDEAVTLARALYLVLPHVSRARVLENCLPTKVGPTLFRIDLEGLQWDVKAWERMVADYPYSPVASVNPLVVRADWLLPELTDCSESAAYYEFVYGVKPKTRAEAFKSFGINEDAAFTIGLVEGQSRVSVSGKRRITNFPGNQRGDAWLTNDTFELDPAQDPLEQPQAGVKHNGEEGIIRSEKTHRTSGVTGTFQYYFLANGEGGIVDKAPANLVVDHTNIRGVEIINGISCISCHATGLNWPTENELRAYIKSGVEVYADYKDTVAIEQFHLADVDKYIRRSNEDFADIVEKAIHAKPEIGVAAFQLAVHRYDSALTLERAAAEVYMVPGEFKNALALASGRGHDLGARVSGLAHGKTIPRDSWKAQYTTVRQYVEQWRQGAPAP